MQKIQLAIMSALVLAAGRAEAAGVRIEHGLLSGINLIYNGGANPLSLTGGMGVTTTHSRCRSRPTLLPPTLTVGSSPLAKNTHQPRTAVHSQHLHVRVLAYYCYVVYAAQAVAGTPPFGPVMLALG